MFLTQSRITREHSLDQGLPGSEWPEGSYHGCYLAHPECGQHRFVGWTLSHLNIERQPRAWVQQARDSGYICFSLLLIGGLVM